MSEKDEIRCVRPEDTGSERDDDWLKEAWYKGSYLHREDGPAMIYQDGTEIWYQNGKRHREDGPAMTVPEEVAAKGEQPMESWYQNGVQHREDGPAIIYPSGRKIYFERGRRIREEP